MAKNSYLSESTKKTSAMAALLAKHKDKTVILKRGDIVKGKLVKLSKQEIIIDINAKAEAIAVEKDPSLMQFMLSNLKEGQEVTAQIISPESESGQPLVSLRKFIEDLIWSKLQKLQQSREGIEVVVKDITRGGLIVQTLDGITGFLPQSHTSINFQNITVGSHITVFVFELNRQDNKILFTQKTLISDEEFEELTKQYEPGKKITATVSSITPFGIFVTINLKHPKTGETVSIDGLIHISEVAWEKIEDLQALYQTGQTIEALILGVDKEGRRLDLSIKRLTADPFEEIVKKFPVDTKVKGIVTGISAGNVSVNLGDGIEGIIRKDKIPPTITYNIGEEINAIVSDIDIKRHKILLSPLLLEKPIGYR